MALDAIEAGKDVDLEKSMTYTIDEAVKRTGRVDSAGSGLEASEALSSTVPQYDAQSLCYKF